MPAILRTRRLRGFWRSFHACGGFVSFILRVRMFRALGDFVFDNKKTLQKYEISKIASLPSKQVFVLVKTRFASTISKKLLSQIATSGKSALTSHKVFYFWGASS